VPGSDGYFDERIAAQYDENESELFDPAVVNPTVDFLVENAGVGRALELGWGRAGSRYRSPSEEYRYTGSSSRGGWRRGYRQSLVVKTSA